MITPDPTVKLSKIRSRWIKPSDRPASSSDQARADRQPRLTMILSSVSCLSARLTSPRGSSSFLDMRGCSTGWDGRVEPSRLPFFRMIFPRNRTVDLTRLDATALSTIFSSATGQWGGSPRLLSFCLSVESVSSLAGHSSLKRGADRGELGFHGPSPARERMVISTRHAWHS